VVEGLEKAAARSWLKDRRRLPEGGDESQSKFLERT
jgi:hypothetical protein